MKSKKLLFVGMLALIMGQVNLIASEKATMATAKKDLTEQIYNIVNEVPIEILSARYSNDLTIYFRVTDEGELSSVEVQGQNESLNYYVKMRITRRSFHADPLLSGVKYRIPVSYNVK